MKSCLSAAFVLLFTVLHGAEYFVAINGNDSSDGTSEKTAFRTVQKGVNALDAGDTLTILPGTYHEAVRRTIDGDAAKKTVIRAKYPGSVLIHGDLPLTDFQAVDAERGLYAVSCPEEPEAVIEYETLTLYEKARPDFLTAQVPNAASWYYDAEQKKIYLRTSDGKIPAAHRLARVTKGADGLILTPGLKGNVVNVEIDGLMARGFIKHDLAAYSSVWGISIVKPVNCVIRRCCAVLSSGGINMTEAQKSRIEDCIALGNGTSKMVSGGNIIVTTGADSVIDHCFSFASRMYGIRFYGQNTRDSILRSVSIEDERGSVWIKPCDKDSILKDVFTPGYVACNHTENSVFRGNEYDANGNNGKSSLYLKKDVIHSFPDDFADPGNFDLRLTDGSRFQQGFAGKDFFYLAPDGNDQNSGHSRKSPKKSLAGIKDGATIYLLPGNYTESLHVTQNDLTIAGYGQTGPAVIRGTLQITGNQIRLRNLSFVSPETSIVSDGEDLQIKHCGFAGNKVAVQTKKTAIFRHCAFDESVQKITDHPGDVFLMSCIMNKAPADAVLFGNAYAGAVPVQDANGISLPSQFTSAANGDFSLKNESEFLGTAADGTMIGPCSFLYEPERHHYSSMKILSAGTQTASIQYEKSASAHSASWAMFREAGKEEWVTVPDFTVSTSLSYISLNGLKPDTKYECYICSRRGNRYAIGNHWLPNDLDYKKASQSKSDVLSFTTPAADRASQFWHVAPDGNDRNPGSLQQPFRTIAKASLMTAPGDIVLVHGGTYQESVLVPISGTAEHPITYCAAPGETVWIDGVNRQFCRTFAAFGKQYINFDGFRVKSFGTALSNSSGVFLLFGSNHIRMTRSMHDGRGYGYAPAILNARNCSDLVMKNCVNISSMGGICVFGSDRVTLENNVLKMSLIWHLSAGGKKNAIRFVRNVVTDSSRSKTEQPLLMPDRSDLIVEQDNLYFCRMPRELRAVVGFSGKKYTLDEYYKVIGKDGRSVFDNPAIQAMPKQLSWNSWADRTADMKKGVDFQREVNNYENGRNPGNHSQFRVWDFSDFFTNPIRKTPEGEIIGLEPEQFKDFPKVSDPDKSWHTF